jgi:dienelactone hydrolase
MKLIGFARYYKNTKEADISIGGNMVEKHFVLKSGDLSLNAVYTFVNDGKVHPTALIIGGSGPIDLDCTVGVLRPLHDLAVGLAENNINTLRVDKRTYLNVSSFKVTDGIEEEYLTDCDAALNYIRSQPSADINNIYIIGHSLGGQIAAEMTNRYDDIKGIVELNSSARNLALIAYDQYVAKEPAKEAEYAEYRDAALNANENNCKGSYYYGATDYYWATLNKLDAIKAIKDNNIKTLIINSKKDAQSFEADIELWQTAFSNADNVTIKIFDNMSHFLYDIDINDNKSLYNRVELTDGVVDTIKDFIS